MMDKTNDKCPIQVARITYIGPLLEGQTSTPIPVEVAAGSDRYLLSTKQARVLAQQILDAANDAERREVAPEFRCSCGGMFTPVFEFPANRVTDHRCATCGVRRSWLA